VTKEVEDYYRALASNYIKDEAYSRRYHRRRFDAFLALMPARGENEPLRVFDFGCGSGELLIELRRRGHVVSGSDVSREMLEQGQVKLAAAGFQVPELLLGGIETLAALPGACFDVVGALNVLPYLSEEDEDEFFRQSLRLLRAGGSVIFSHTNMLVDLVTLNRYTVEFWRDHIIPSLAANAEESEELLAQFAGHLVRADQPPKTSARKSERDFLKKRRVNPITYPKWLADQHGLRVEAVRYTHYYPMPPQFIEQSPKYRMSIFDFEDRFRDNPLSCLFASIMVMRARKG
jgi:2-polyprenyl-3-methyl-5-hydroxy-6-metoxy-1,4-benzoquinol methylase